MYKKKYIIKNGDEGIFLKFWSSKILKLICIDMFLCFILKLEFV